MSETEIQAVVEDFIAENYIEKDIESGIVFDKADLADLLNRFARKLLGKVEIQNGDSE